jgi:hypothetical protein
MNKREGRNAMERPGFLGGYFREKQQHSSQ